MTKMTTTAYMSNNYFEYAMASEKQLDYRILIASPTDEPPAEGYAAVYVLDGDALFATLAEAVKLQTRKPKGYEPIIVIGIGYPSREPFDFERRFYDFTPQVHESQLNPRPDGSAWPANGHADDFLDFLEQELMPAVAEEWPINLNKQAIVGHSLGGLFTLYTLCARPHLFSHIVAGSPSVWWGDNDLLNKLASFAGTSQGSQSIQLLLTIGANELPDMLEGANQVAEYMKQLTKQINTQYVIFSEEDHVSVLPCMLSRIPRFLHGE